MTEKIVVIDNPNDVLHLRDRIKDWDYVAFDTETTGLTREDKIIGFSVSPTVDEGYYIILRAWDKAEGRLVSLDTEPVARDFLQALEGKKLICHNAVFDCIMVEANYGVKLMPHMFCDTMLLAHLLDENRRIGLKELATSIFGETSTIEQAEMKASILANGGELTKDNYELYKGDLALIGKYGAKDTILTMKLFYELVPQLYDQGLDKFFFEDETMPLLRGPTYQLNTVGLAVDLAKLQSLQREVEAFCLETKAAIYQEITPIVQVEYLGTSKKNTFNVGAGQQLSWLLFEKLGNEFSTLTDEGKVICNFLGLPLPYTNEAKRQFKAACKMSLGRAYAKTPAGRDKTIGEYWKYLATDKGTLPKYAKKHRWVSKVLELSKANKLLSTYIVAIREQTQYGIIRPQFNQAGTTSGRYSSKKPNFQNLPRDDKRVKSCIVSRPNRSFVGADFSQLEPRIFASFSEDLQLLACFAEGHDFYSVIGSRTFNKYDCTMVKDDANSFANKYPKLRQIAKTIALSLTYGTTPPKLATALGCSIEEAREISDNYFESFPDVRKLMDTSHKQAMADGQVVNLYGRPRRMPQAKTFPLIYGNAPMQKWPYVARNTLNLAVNHKIQSTAASIMNRCAIAFDSAVKRVAEYDKRWNEVKMVLQCHDEVIIEAPDVLAEDVSILLKHSMEETIQLPGVRLLTEPKIAKNLADLK